MKSSRLSVALSCAAACLGLAASAARAAPTLIESWEGSLDGWQVPSPFGGNTTYVSGFSAIGATDGALALSVSGTANPNYGQMLLGPSTTALTAILGAADSISLDVYAPPGSFGYFLQIDIDINNADIGGFVSLDGYNYGGANIGGEATITVPITAAQRAALAASSSPTGIIVQIGGGLSDGNETMYLDNLRVNTVSVPEPTSLAGFAAAGLLGLARRRAR